MSRLAASLMLLGVASSAAAAPPGPAVPGRDDVGALRDYAQCLADRHSRQVAGVLQAEAGSRGYRDRLKALVERDSDCGRTGRLGFDDVLLVGNLAEALLPTALGGASLSRATAFDPARPPLAAHDEGEYLGLCTVRTAPDEAAALFASRPLSQHETSALQSLAPHLGPCLKAGAKAKFNTPGLRATIAVAAYRLVQQNKVAAVAANGN